MRQHGAAAGLQDVVIVNTCAVTAEAVCQARQTVRRLRRERPGARLIVTGCAAQTDPGQFAALPEVDHVIGNADKMRAETYAGLGISGSARIVVNDIMSVPEPHRIWSRLWRPHPGVHAGAEWLRSPLHVLYHPVRRGRFPLGPVEVVTQVRTLVEIWLQRGRVDGVDFILRERSARRSLARANGAAFCRLCRSSAAWAVLDPMRSRWTMICSCASTGATPHAASACEAASVATIWC